jgi:hemoglobin
VTAPDAARPSLYEVAGGQPAMLALAAAHHARCLADPELNHPFSHDDLDPHHIAHLADYWGEVLGGPHRYSDSLGSQTSLLTMHAGNGDMTDLGRRFVECFAGAMDDAGLPADAALRTALRAYMEWAVADMIAYPEKEPTVPAGLPMPRWTWDGLASGQTGSR